MTDTQTKLAQILAESSHPSRKNYTHIVRFRRRWLTGPYKGKDESFEDTVDHVDYEHCQRWIDNVRKYRHDWTFAYPPTIERKTAL